MSTAAKPEIKIFPDLEAMSHAAARVFEDLANARASEGKKFCAALSGGSTPARLYELLASPNRTIPWDHVQLFQVDERCVPPDHPESNFKMIREALLQHISLPGSNFHRMEAENADRDAASRAYAQEITEVLHPEAGERPRMDLIFLGMGADGHTASLFPGSPALSEQEVWVRPNYSERLKSFRLTLTYPVLNAAAQVIFLVAGADKAETLRKILSSPQGSPEFPAQGVQPANGQLNWYLDQGAARLLAL
ncbi:MAG TPA: 6-phosphogluconolactonase [Terriglobia bacterium]|nr:6-phosphogluconolactonase [Terriglobia bacterium]